MDFNFDFDEKIEQLARVPKAIRLVTVVGILCGIVVGYYFMSYQGQKENVRRLHGEAQKLQRQLNKVRVVANNLADFQQEVADLERDLELALTQLPDRKQFEDLLQDISTAGKKVGVSIGSLTRQNEVRHDFYAEVPFSLEIEGSYHDVAMFFERVARLPRIVNIGTMSVHVERANSAGTVLKVDGRATTFRFLGEGEHARVTRSKQNSGKA